jgi:low temperature requirement protein LtrA
VTGTPAVEPADAKPAEELRVSSLELFFDLVFVFTLTQLTSLLGHALSVVGAVQVVLIFVVLFWMYGGFVWLTNQLPPNVPARRLLLIAGMAAFFVCALAIPHAFEATGLAFGIGYLLVVLVHGGLYFEGYGRAVWRFVPLNILGALCVVGASFVDGAGRYAMWLAPILLQYASSQLTSRVDESTRAGFDIRPGHFVERHGLLLLVAFGESVVAIGIGLADRELGPDVYAAAILALVLASTLWWTYFGEDERRAEETLASAPIARRLQMALGAYFYAYIVILLGVITVAAGIELAIGDVRSRLSVESALLLGGGIALFLAGNVGFRVALGVQPLRYRLIAALLALATTAVGVAISGLAQLLALVATIVGLFIAEGSRRSVSRGG